MYIKSIDLINNTRPGDRRPATQAAAAPGKDEHGGDLMAAEIIGMVRTREFSETRGPLAGPAIDSGYLTRFARAHEAAGFDRVLIGYGATGPDGFAVAAHVLYATTTLKVLIAHQGAEAMSRRPARGTAITKLTGPGGNSTALVGTPDQVAEALLGLPRGRRGYVPDPRLRPARRRRRLGRGPGAAAARRCRPNPCRGTSRVMST